MSLKKQFKIISVVIIALALNIGVFIFLQTQELGEEIEENRVANEMMNGIFELNLLVDDYLQYPGERAQEQWQSRYQSIGKLFQQDIVFEAPEKIMIWNSMYDDYKSLQSPFSKLVKNIKNRESGGTEGLYSQEFEKRLATELLVKLRVMLSNTSRLMEENWTELSDLQYRIVLFVIFSIVGLVMSIILVLLMLTRILLGPILTLQKGVEIIGAGNLKHQINIKRKDEIGALALSFNNMTGKLRKSYTELEKKIKELKKAYEELKELDKLKDQFLNTTTHELKTPLIPIKSQAQLLLDGDYGILNREQKEAIEMIYKNEDHMERLVTDVLDITKVKSKKLLLILEKADFGKIVSDSVKNMRELAKREGITLSIKSIPELPEISIDSKRIAQVINNLLSNALKYTLEKEKIEIEVGKEKNDVIVSIKDNGIGMSKRTLGKLFTPFFQADARLARKYGGTGLGLFICKGIIKAHGGKMWAESKGKNKGSTFVFTLPIKKADKAKK